MVDGPLDGPGCPGGDHRPRHDHDARGLSPLVCPSRGILPHRLTVFFVPPGALLEFCRSHGALSATRCFVRAPVSHTTHRAGYFEAISAMGYIVPVIRSSLLVGLCYDTCHFQNYYLTCFRNYLSLVSVINACLLQAFIQEKSPLKPLC